MSNFIKTGLVLSGLILLGAGCARVSETSKNSESSETSKNSTAVAPVGPPTAEAVIEYTEGVFNPATLRVLTGTKVTFVNKGTKDVWPASGRHPTHEICPGFDALKALKSGATYSYRFEKSAECPFHNHVAPGEKGSIEVKSE